MAARKTSRNIWARRVPHERLRELGRRQDAFALRISVAHGDGAAVVETSADEPGAGGVIAGDGDGCDGQLTSAQPGEYGCCDFIGGVRWQHVSATGSCGCDDARLEDDGEGYEHDVTEDKQ
jgi:hypothetical protein